MGKLSEEIGQLVEDYIPAKIIKLPEEAELETEVDEETETETETVDETETETTEDEPEEETSEVVDEEEGEETEEETEDPETAEVETEEEDETSDDEDDEESNPLFDQLNALASGQIDIDDEEVSKSPEQPAEQPEEQSSDPFDLLGGLDFDEVVSKPEVFKQVLERAGEHMRETIQSQVVQAVTQIAGYQVQQQMALQNLTNNFWKENQDLEPVRPYVAKIASTIQSKRPDMPLQKIFEKTAEVARKNLGLKKPKGGGGSPNPKRGNRPALVKTSGGVRKTKTAPKITGVQKQIADLIDL